MAIAKALQLEAARRRSSSFGLFLANFVLRILTAISQLLNLISMALTSALN